MAVSKAYDCGANGQRFEHRPLPPLWSKPRTLRQLRTKFRTVYTFIITILQYRYQMKSNVRYGAIN